MNISNDLLRGVDLSVEVFRNDDFSNSVNELLPMDLLSLRLSNVPDQSSTVVSLFDFNGEKRYMARLRDQNPVFTTRVQNTRKFGKWYFLIEFFDELYGKIEFCHPVGIVSTLRILEPLQEVKITQISNSELKKALVEAKVELTEIFGIGPSTKQKLESVKICSINDLLDYEPSQVSEMIDIALTKVTLWYEHIRTQYFEKGKWFNQDRQIKSISSDITLIKGIGKKLQSVLFEAAGIQTIEDLSHSNPTDLEQIIGLKKAVKFISAAKEFLSQEQDETISNTFNEGDISKVEHQIDIELVGTDSELNYDTTPITTKDKISTSSYVEVDPPSKIYESNMHDIDEKLNNLIKLKGIGKKRAEILIENSIDTPELLNRLSERELAEMLKVSDSIAHKLKTSISESSSIQKEPLQQSNLTTLKGLGPTYETRLRENGVNSMRDLKLLEIEEIKSITKAPLKRVKEWKSELEILC